MSEATLPVCDSFAGNSDLYGLGIRIGVYLQWFSSWLINFVDIETAEGTHEANSLFIFSVMVATARAASTHNLRPVEAYLMLQICFGYLITVFSIIGVRIQFLGWKRLARFAKEARKFPRAVWERKRALREQIRPKQQRRPVAGSRIASLVTIIASTILRVVTLLQSLRIPFATFSFLKPRAMSWNGVLWRTVIANAVASCNIWFWFRGLQEMNTSYDCEFSVFFFSQQRLHGGLVILYKLGAIFYAVIVGLFLIFFSLITLELVRFAILCVYKQVSLLIDPSSSGDLLRVKPLLGFFSSCLEFLPSQMSAFIKNTFPIVDPMYWRTDKDNIPTIPDILKAYVGLTTGQEDPPETTIPPHRTFYTSLCILWHIFIGGSIVWFIICVELTLQWNNITGVDTIQSTGQLIPFIIGVVGTVKAFRQSAVVVIKWAYPDWNDVFFDVSLGPLNRIQAEMRRKNLETPESPLEMRAASPISPTSTIVLEQAPATHAATASQP